MTVGALVPLAFLAIALVEIAIFRKWRADGLVSERAATIMTASSLAIPAILFLLFALVFPDIGAMQLF